MGTRLLWTLPYLPWPITAGGKLRQHHLLHALVARGYRITLLVQSKTMPDESVMARLAPMVERLIVLPRRSLSHPWSVAAGALSPHPLLVSVNGHAPKLTQAFDQLIQQPWDVVQVEHSYGLQPYWSVLRQRRQPFVLVEHNVESAMGEAVYGRLPKWLRGGFQCYDQWRYRRWERRALRAPARLVAVTDDDAHRLEAISQRPVDVVVNGVDTAAFEEVQPDVMARRLLFVGNYEYAPNLDAVEWMMSDILPRVWRQMPDLRCTICGYALPAAWPQRWADPRIEWKGFVEDLRTEQRRASVFFAPLRSGGGSKLKVLEAMAAGLAVIGTPQAMSGLSAGANQGCRTAKSAEALAAALAQLLDRPEVLRAMGSAGRAYVRARHDWSIAAAQLESVHQQLPVSS